MKTPTGFLGLLCALVGGSPSALAQPAPPAPAAAPGPAPPAAPARGKPQTPLADSLAGDAREAFVSAGILFNNNDFAGALTKYQQAYGLAHDARLLFNMAVCARGLKQYARMQSLLVRYQREGDSTMSPDTRTDVANALDAIRNFVGTVALTVSEPGVSVELDGAPVGTTPLGEPLRVDLGRHRLTFRKPGFEPVEQSLEVAGGNETALSVTMTAHQPMGQLIVSADEKAAIFIDEQAVTQGRFEGLLPAGGHRLRVSEPGKVTYRADVDLRDEETRTMQVTLENEPHAAVWPWIVGGAAVVVAGGALGSYFLFFNHSSSSPSAPPDPLGSLQLSMRRR